MLRSGRQRNSVKFPKKVVGRAKVREVEWKR